MVDAMYALNSAKGTQCPSVYFSTGNVTSNGEADPFLLGLRVIPYQETV